MATGRLIRTQLFAIDTILGEAAARMEAAGLEGPHWYTDEGTSPDTCAFRTIFCRALEARRAIEYSDDPEVSAAYLAHQETVEAASP